MFIHNDSTNGQLCFRNNRSKRINLHTSQGTHYSSRKSLPTVSVTAANVNILGTTTNHVITPSTPSVAQNVVKFPEARGAPYQSPSPSFINDTAPAHRNDLPTRSVRRARTYACLRPYPSKSREKKHALASAVDLDLLAKVQHSIALQGPRGHSEAVLDAQEGLLARRLRAYLIDAGLHPAAVLAGLKDAKIQVALEKPGVARACSTSSSSFPSPSRYSISPVDHSLPHVVAALILRHRERTSTRRRVNGKSAPRAARGSPLAFSFGCC